MEDHDASSSRRAIGATARRRWITGSIAIAAFISVFVISRAGPNTYSERGLTLSYPRPWRVASDHLTPKLTDPREIVVLGTGRMEPGGTCYTMPENAIRAMSDEDALIWIAERADAGDVDSVAPSLPPPPARFRDADDSHDCIPDKRFTSWWFGFKESGRGFHVHIVFGTRASDERRDDAWKMIKELEVQASE